MNGLNHGPQPGLRPINFREISLAPIDLDDGSDEPYIFATLRYDTILAKSRENTAASFNRSCPFYLLEHQWTRLQVANWCTSFYRQGEPSNGCGGASNFFRGLSSVVRKWRESDRGDTSESLRIKIRAYTSGRTTIEIGPLARIPLNQLFKSTLSMPDLLAETEWTVVLDYEATAITESTMYKTSDRLPYSRARAIAGIPSLTYPKEVLLYNPSGDILDGSTSTPYFYRNGKWVTPTSSCGGLQGTTRRWALENGLCVEGVVSKDSLHCGEFVWFSNAVKGFFHATFEARGAVPAKLDLEECQRAERQMQR